MIEKQNPYLSEMARRPSKRSPIQPIVPISQPKVDWSDINASTQIANNNAFVWNTHPKMDHYPPIVRGVATIIGKIILYFSQVITKPQQQFNTSILHALVTMQNGMKSLEQHLVSCTQQLNELSVVPTILENVDKRITQLDKDSEIQMDRINQMHRDTEFQATQIVKLIEQSSIFIEVQQSLSRMVEIVDQIKETFARREELVSLAVSITDLSRRVDLLNSLNERVATIYHETRKIEQEISTIQSTINILPSLEAELHKTISQVDTLLPIESRVQKIQDSVTHTERLVHDHSLHIDSFLLIQPQVTKLQESISKIILDVTTQERRLGRLLEEARNRLPGKFDEKQLQQFANELDALNDKLYVSFEDRFRGTREEIKNRVSIYIPMIENAGAGSKDFPVLDVGCGRGEWLEVLKQNHLSAVGLDINTTMVEQCITRGLSVEKGDVIEYLKKQSVTKFGAVTGFHIIEHLPFEVWLRVFDESFRVLKSGGMIIFETPNPANVLVGSNNFYLDPTHRNPLPGDMVKFIAEERGFTRVELLQLHPVEGKYYLQENTEVDKRFNQYFYGPQDYAVIGYKP